MAVSSLVGSASGLPGGLGATDRSVLGHTRVLVSGSATSGGAATQLTRFCTLWFGLLIGASAFCGYRAIQRVDVTIEPVGTMEKQEGNIYPDISHHGSVQPVLDHLTLLSASLSVPMNTGEKVV